MNSFTTAALLVKISKSSTNSFGNFTRNSFDCFQECLVFIFYKNLNGFAMEFLHYSSGDSSKYLQKFLEEFLQGCPRISFLQGRIFCGCSSQKSSRDSSNYFSKNSFRESNGKFWRDSRRTFSSRIHSAIFLESLQKCLLLRKFINSFKSIVLVEFKMASIRMTHKEILRELRQNFFEVSPEILKGVIMKFL